MTPQLSHTVLKNATTSISKTSPLKVRSLSNGQDRSLGVWLHSPQSDTWKQSHQQEQTVSIICVTNNNIPFTLTGFLVLAINSVWTESVTKSGNMPTYEITIHVRQHHKEVFGLSEVRFFHLVSMISILNMIFTSLFDLKQCFWCWEEQSNYSRYSIQL